MKAASGRPLDPRRWCGGGAPPAAAAVAGARGGSAGGARRTGAQLAAQRRDVRAGRVPRRAGRARDVLRPGLAKGGELGATRQGEEPPRGRETSKRFQGLNRSTRD